MRKKIVKLSSVLLLLVGLLAPIALNVKAEEKKINVSGPEIGQHPTFATSDSTYTIIEQAWVNITDGTNMTANDVFEANKYYAYTVKYSGGAIYPSYPLSALTASEYNIGGGGMTDEDGNDVSENLFCMNNSDSCPSYPQTEAIIDMDNPEIGQKAPTAKANSKYEIIDEVWYNLTDDREMAANDVFEANKRYEYEVEYKSTYQSYDFFKNLDSEYFLDFTGEVHLGITSKLDASFYFGNRNDLKVKTGDIVVGNNVEVAAGKKIQNSEITYNREGIYLIYDYWVESINNGEDYKYIGSEEDVNFKSGTTYIHNVSAILVGGYELAEDFAVIDNSKNDYFVNAEITSTNYNEDTHYVNYGATFTIPVEAESIEITEPDTSVVYPGDTKQLMAKVLPTNAKDKNLTWTSSNESIATIDNQGLVTAVAPGETTITARSVNGVTATYKFKVSTPVESVSLNKEEITLEEDMEDTLVATITPNNATNKVIAWTSSNTKVATVDANGKVTAIAKGTAKITAVSHNGKKAECNVTVKLPKVKLTYTTHVQYVGWQNYVKAGKMAGTSGKALRLEGIKIKVESDEYTGNIEYKTHVQYVGWEKEFKKNDEISGTMGKSLRLEGIRIRLTGELEEHYDIYYRVHAEQFGWLGWAKNGEDSGTAGYAFRLEGIEIKLVEKGNEFSEYGEKDAFKEKYAVTGVKLNKTNLTLEAGDEEELSATVSPSNASNPNLTWTSSNTSVATVDTNGKVTGVSAGTSVITATSNNGKKATCNVTVTAAIPGVAYTTHVQYVGWQKYVKNGEMAGTSGKSLRLEGIKIKLKNIPYDGDIEYTTHVQYIGWQDYVKNNAMAGTSGKGLRLEGIRIRLTGEVANHYDIYYRVHAQQFGWLGWAKNGEDSGTAGYAFRLEGIEIKLVEKDAAFPEYGDKEAFKDKNDKTESIINQKVINLANYFAQSFPITDLNEIANDDKLIYGMGVAHSKTSFGFTYSFTAAEMESYVKDLFGKNMNVVHGDIPCPSKWEHEDIFLYEDGVYSYNPKHGGHGATTIGTNIHKVAYKKIGNKVTAQYKILYTSMSDISFVSAYYTNYEDASNRTNPIITKPSNSSPEDTSFVEEGYQKVKDSIPTTTVIYNIEKDGTYTLQSVSVD